MIPECIQSLSTMPGRLEAMVEGLPEAWLLRNEGEGTWNTVEVIAHLVYGEQTDWIPRTKIILSKQNREPFVPFDRNGHAHLTDEFTPDELLQKFRQLRTENMRWLKKQQLNEQQLMRTGIHPEFGEITLKQMLAAWTVHDYTHLSQISRLMAKPLKADTGPWEKYMSILNR